MQYILSTCGGAFLRANEFSAQRNVCAIKPLRLADERPIDRELDHKRPVVADRKLNEPSSETLPIVATVVRLDVERYHSSAIRRVANPGEATYVQTMTRGRASKKIRDEGSKRLMRELQRLETKRKKRFKQAKP